MSEFTVNDGVLTKYTGPGGVIALPEGVLQVRVGAFTEKLHDITGMVLPDGVREIGFSAFNGCTGLKTIGLPDTLPC